MFNDLDRRNNKENEKEKKSLVKEMVKKGISKKIKALPLKTKLIIVGIIFGIVLFLLIFIALCAPLMSILFFDSSGSSSSSGSNLAYVEVNSEDNYWWPIGGEEIEEKDGIEYATGTPMSTNVTSEYSVNKDRDLGYGNESHSGMDIGVDKNRPDDTYYIIAAMKGTVYSVFNGCDNNGSLQTSCGNTYGNHIVILHPNGVYTIYAHLYPNSIRVSVGDSVNQGQIIGEMGSSGRVTGKHLHIGFEIGSRGNSENPRKYIDPENPRPVTVPSTSGSNTTTGEDNYIEMLRSWEGAKMSDDGKYLVYSDDGAGILTVGHGVTLINNPKKFEARGIDINNVKAGDSLDVSLVNEIEEEIIAEKNEEIENILKNNNITLEKHQKEALLIRYYNTGTLAGFADKYKEYGNTEALYDNYMNSPVTADGKYLEGLARRRKAEFDLFNKNIYTYN